MAPRRLFPKQQPQNNFVISMARKQRKKNYGFLRIAGSLFGTLGDIWANWITHEK